ncbi:hypothetical protein pb186bvf_002951 [Paramecium bursaria]
MNPIKYQSLQSNPYFLQQVENFLKDSSSLIKKGAYRKVIQVLDSHNKKLKQIDCPLSTRLTIQRRLIYCSLQYFKQKINKGEINQGNTQLILWGRLYIYFQELHELMHHLKVQKKKMFFIQELIKSIIQAYIYRAYYFAKNNTVAMGVLSYHKMIDKWNFNAEKNPQICEYLGQHHLVSAGIYFNLNLFQNAQDEYYQALSYILMSFQFQYEQIVTLNQDVIQKKLKRIVQTLIICLFGLALAAEQNKCYQLYYEGLKTLTWIDQHFMNQSSFTQLLIGQLDQNKYHQYLRDQKEIKKALSMVIEINQKQEKQQINQDLVSYFDNILFKYTKGIYQNYFFVDRKQSLENQDTEQEIISPKLSGSQYLITKNSQFEQSQMSTLQLQSNSKIKKKLSEPSNSNGTHSTRIQTDFDISKPPVSPKQKTMPSKLEDITLNQFYDNIIEKSCRIEQLNEMNEKLIYFHHSEQAVGKIFDKDINLYRNNLQFKQFFGNITGRQLGKTLKIKQVVKEAHNNVKTAQTIVDSQIFLKRKTDKPLMILNDQKKDMKSILFKQSDKLGLAKTVRTIKYLKPNSPNIETEVAPEVVFAKNKEIIRTLMDEKEKEIQILPKTRQMIKKRTTHQSAASLLARLLAMNDGLAKSTENISHKRPQNIKSLIDISRKKIRDTTNAPSSNTYRENSKDRSQIM